MKGKESAARVGKLPEPFAAHPAGEFRAANRGLRPINGDTAGAKVDSGLAPKLEAYIQTRQTNAASGLLSGSTLLVRCIRHWRPRTLTG